MAATALVAGVFAGAGCREQPMAPTAATSARVTMQPAFVFTNNPDNGNANIIRSEQGFMIYWVGAQTSVQAVHLNFPVPGCGDIPSLDPASYQAVLNPRLHFAVNEMGPVWIIVRDLAAAGDCLGAKLLASGVGRIHYTNSNEWLGAVEGTNHIGYTAAGDLTTPDGASVHYNGEWQANARFADGQWSYVSRVQRVNLR